MNGTVCVTSGIMLLWVLTLTGCGAGEAGRSKSVAKPQLNSQDLQWSTEQTAKRQIQLAQSIDKIKKNPLTQHFAMTTSYPYLITGNLSQSEVEHWKSRIQRTQAAIKSMYFSQDPSELVHIWLFKNASDYYQYNQSLWGASPGASFGYYLPKQKRMVMNIASGGGTLTHELVHPYIEANFPRSPLWFNEGLASLYEESFYRGGKVFGKTNWRLTGLKVVIDLGAMPSLQNMMQTNREQFLGPNREVYYAQARYLMLYLQSRGLLQEYYRQFVASVDSDPRGIKTLLSVTKSQSLEQLEKSWVRFVGGLYY